VWIRISRSFFHVEHGVVGQFLPFLKLSLPDFTKLGEMTDADTTFWERPGRYPDPDQDQDQD